MSEVPIRVLLAGESWIVESTHQKGVDAFSTISYGVGHTWLYDTLTQGGIQVEHLPGHLVPSSFPNSIDALNAYDVVFLSDIGSNSLLLHPDTFERSISLPNRLAVLRDWVAAGGALVMVGGYLTFQGIEGKAQYAGSPVEEALPVTMLRYDDRIEAPQGLQPECSGTPHAITDGLAGVWPPVLGYNQVFARPEAEVLATVNGDPLLTSWSYGEGRAVAFMSDCAPHWLTPEFIAWAGYHRLWTQLVRWAAGQVPAGEAA